ncbi:hypothetical protein PHISCL_07778 [Aspergillus sclerotialis]|uniref:Uncharacterized protein n=1 Tax=Aspergillus sclerotialis TaxID=2070753 RepID=A0A3A2ZEY5_9EURO|nr:hypothetical protein PHISCL_07778 [Aspergillus sclerotialis]
MSNIMSARNSVHSIAFTFLLNILASGAPFWTPAHIPSPAYLAIAATCVVHPRTTTRAQSSGDKEAASLALALLRTTNESVGPVAAEFGAAFSFAGFEASRQDRSLLNVGLAQEGSLWARTEDFWHAVGWAFNCSILHPKRWERWRLWLEFMCEVLEDDWDERVRLVEKAVREDPGSGGELLKGSLIFQYIDGGNAVGFGGSRRILRAIFADASSSAVNEFGQIFPKELEPLIPDNGSENTNKRENKHQYGNDLSDSENTDKELKPATNRRPKRARRSTRTTTTDTSSKSDSSNLSSQSTYRHPDTSYLGGMSSLSLRKRLLSLLANVSSKLPKTFLPTEDLYRLFIENIRHLSLCDFQAIVSATSLDYFTTSQQADLCEYLIYSMRESSAPKVDRDAPREIKLEQYFLPYAASTSSIAANAKMSITLTALFVILSKNGLLSSSKGLKGAVERGVAARKHKAKTGGKKVQGSFDKQEIKRLEELEWCWLRESEGLMISLLDMI